MTDYRVIYVPVPKESDKRHVTLRIETECDHAAREGWYLDHTVADMEGGTTIGMWLIFVAEEEDDEERPEVMAAERILDEATGGSGEL